MTAKRRNRLSSSSFALKRKRKYPIDTPGRARNALARVRQHGTRSQQRTVQRAVKKRYPSIKVTRT